jgi:nitrate/TMAO reductase-like tetraheme cytochrome c subunit
MSLRKWVSALRTPSARYSLGTLLAVGVVAGAAAVPTFTFMVHETSTDAFCLSCHDRDIGLELPGTAHFDGPLGVRATCADCHLPKAFWPKVAYKAKAGAKDVYHHMLGTIDTPEKFEAHRMHMASIIWEEMDENDSRECRSCHDQAKWGLTEQSEKAREYHSPALANGKTCIDCHKGITHRLPEGIEPDYEP